MTSVVGVYFALFVSLPVTIRVYEWADRLIHGRRAAEKAGAELAAAPLKVK